MWLETGLEALAYMQVGGDMRDLRLLPPPHALLKLTAEAVYPQNKANSHKIQQSNVCAWAKVVMIR